MTNQELLRAMEFYAARYGLTRQTAKMLALLVIFPTVSQETLNIHFNATKPRNVVARLRARMKDHEDLSVGRVTAIMGLGYTMVPELRERLSQEINTHVS